MIFLFHTLFAQNNEVDSIIANKIFLSAKKEIICLNACGNILQKQRKFDEATVFLNKSQNTGLKYPKNREELANAFHLKSLILYKTGEYNNAIFNEKRATKIWKRTGQYNVAYG